MVHQELAFCEHLTVAENLCLGALPASLGIVDHNAMEVRAATMLAEVGAGIDVRAQVGRLSTAQQQLVQIASAVGAGARIIVFDEPTSSLSLVDVERLYDLIERLKQRGVTLLFVSHRMAEVYRVCDSVSVLRDGAHVGTHATSSLSEAELVQMMIGRPLSQYFPRTSSQKSGDEVLRTDRLTVPGKFEDISLGVRAGEVVGLAGLVGAGRSELAGALFGLEPASRGDVFVRGKRVHIRSPQDAIALGMGMVPEDRKHQGVVGAMSILHNAALAILRRVSVLGWILRGKEFDRVTKVLNRLDVRSDPHVAVATLSGGNQQKVVVARWLATDASILILDEPTRGVDVGAKAEIHELIGDLAARGAAVLLISSELPEILGLSDRIVVLREGRVAGEVARAQANQETLLRLMAGLSPTAGQTASAVS
jgi:ABC-type sugar transport system ATPase subunit